MNRASRGTSLRTIAIVLIVTLFACKEGPARFRPLSVGEAAPEFAARALAVDSLPNSKPDTISLQSLHGQVVMLNVWATWCLPCLREMPLLDSLSRQYSARGLRILGVSIDSDQGDAKVNQFRSAHNISFTLLRDPESQVTQTFQTRGVPETFLIDRNGKLAMHWIGGIDGSAVEVKAALDKALAP